MFLVYPFCWYYMVICGCYVRHAVAQLVEALHYKLEGCGFNPWWSHRNFSITYSFQPHYDPGVDSASHTNGAKKRKLYGTVMSRKKEKKKRSSFAYLVFYPTSCPLCQYNPYVCCTVHDYLHYTISMFITKVTICWWTVHICHHMYILSICPDHCCQVISSPNTALPCFTQLSQGS